MFLRGLFLCAFKNKLKQTFSKTTRFRTAMLPSSNVQRNNAVSFRHHQQPIFFLIFCSLSSRFNDWVKKFYYYHFLSLWEDVQSGFRKSFNLLLWPWDKDKNLGPCGDLANGGITQSSAFFCSVFCNFVRTFVRSFTINFVCPFVRSFVPSFARLYLRSLVLTSFARLFIGS